MSRWETHSLESICKIITDGAHNSPASVDYGYPMASVKDMTSFGLTLNTCRHISESDYFALVKQGCQPEVNDVLIAKDGATAIDTVCMVKEKKNVVLLSSVAILRPNIETVNPFYLKHYLSCESVKAHIKQTFVTGAAIPRVVLKDFKRLKVELPDLSLQNKIALIVNNYDNLIENNNRRIAILEEMAQKLYREWFVHFRFPGHENVKMVESDMGMIPEGWEIKKLVQIADVIMGQSPKSECYNENGEGLPFHQGVTNFTLLVPKHKTYSTGGSRIANSGDILFSVRAPVGRINLADCKLVLGRGISAIRHKANHQGYLLFTLKAIFDKPDLIGSGSIFNSATKDDMHSIAVLTPHKDIESSFDKTAQQIVNQLILLNAKNTNLRKTRDLLLPRLISGDIDVSELDIPTKEG